MAAQNVKLPDIGEGVTEGELVKWLVKVGDTVKADQPVAEVMTDKATVEVPSPVPGVVKELKFKEGDVIPIETVILLLESGGNGAVAEKPAAPAAAPKPMAAPTQSPAPMQAAAPAATGGMEVHPPVPSANVLATPATRRLAREMGVDLNQVGGTG